MSSPLDTLAREREMRSPEDGGVRTRYHNGFEIEIESGTVPSIGVSGIDGPSIPQVRTKGKG